MKNFLFILITILLLCQCNQSNTNEYIGEYKTTLPDIIESAPSMPENARRTVGMLDWTIVIGEKELVMKLAGREHLRMSYFIEGKSIIGKYNWGDKVVYYPFYFKNKDVAYTWGMELVRVK